MNDEQLVNIIPTERQIKHSQLEFYAFVHFTVNTFTDKEWGDGTESPSIFNPSKMDAEQWVKAVKSAGMRGLILTCKHHDGFCLWPSKFTNHTVAASPYKEGSGDIVKEVSQACRKYDIKFGVYLSPWDRNSALYGQGKEYDDFFIAQLTELLTGYGEVFSVWFDGACGEGPNGKKQYYDWERYYETIRSLQPGACISVCGPDVRWCGNEAGYTRKAEWSVVPERAKDSEIVANKSQMQDDTEFRLRRVDARDEDLGSRKILENEDRLIWYPAEVNTSIRPGWFYHESENDKVRSLEELTNIYIHSVGGNATFLLNIPPTREGLFHENDVKRLEEIGQYIKKLYKNNLTDTAMITFNGQKSSVGCEEDYSQSLVGESEKTNVLEVYWDHTVQIGAVVLKENITHSQRVEHFYIEAEVDGRLTRVYEGTVIGYKRIVKFDCISTNHIRIVIDDCRREPIISFVGVYEAMQEDINIIICSQNEMTKLLSKKKKLQDTVVVSFVSAKTNPKDYVNYYGSVDEYIYVKADDIEIDELDEVNESEETYFCQAKEVAAFIKRAVLFGKTIIFQCEYGQGRSAACAAAVLEYYKKDGISVFSDYRYFPNKLIYHKLLSALRLVSDEKKW